MKERPILFSGPMVRAILSGQKTQTRRILKAAIPPHWQMFPPSPAVESWSAGFVGPELILPCPYGVPGDRLWVRETWKDGGYRPENDRLITYAAGGIQLWRKAPEDYVTPRKPNDWRPSIFMLRSFSRIDLEIVSVRVERLQNITEQDARAEGVGIVLDPDGSPDEPMGTARGAFHGLWNAINGDRATWESNPWVWCVEFKRVAP